MSARIYVDTNVFLDFYRRAGHALSVFEDLLGLGDRLLLTEQTVAEFERNRAKQLTDAMKNLAEVCGISQLSPPDLIGALPEFKPLEKARADAKRLLGEMKTRLGGFLSDESSDPVFVEFRKLETSARLLPTKSENIDKAWRRKLLGQPPFSPGKQSVGDELIWETILEGCDEDLVVVSRDESFHAHEPLLRREFERRTGKKLALLTEKVSEALTLAGKDPTRVLEEERTLREHEREAERLHNVMVSSSLGSLGSLDPRYAYLYASGSVGPFVQRPAEPFPGLTPAAGPAYHALADDDDDGDDDEP